MKQIRFLQNFVSPEFGNVWIGRKSTVKPHVAQRLAEKKLAEIVQEEVDNGVNIIDRGEKSSKGRPIRRR